MKRTPHLLAIQSHVVFGHAGNSAAVFPMQRVGVNVWPLNTVQFSNHTQYGQWAGEVLAPQQIPALVEGIATIGELGNCDGVLSGYLGSAAQGREILSGVSRIKVANPKAVYLCDPVMGHPEKGCIVPAEVSDFLLEEAVAMADYLCPNQLELDSFSGRAAQSLEDCVGMARALLARGPKAVLVKHLSYTGKSAEHFEMLLVTAEGSWHLRRPLLAFPRQPVGVGDLTSGLFLARVLLGDDLLTAFEFTAAAVHEVLLETQACASYELELVRAQDRIVHPRLRFEAVRLPAYSESVLSS
jgi:pyridoxine kinase